jgi:hypothetical protein
MPESTQSREVQVYQFHILLLQISPAIWRRVLVRSDNSLADLHYTIQIVMGWEDFHLHRFVHHGRVYGINKPGVLFDHNPSKVLLRDLHLRLKERFIYEYDFSDSWQHQLRLEQILPLDPTNSYPLCLGGAWQAPPEDCGGAWQYMERRQLTPWRIAERLYEVLEDPQGNLREHLAEFRELVYWQQAHKFDRRAANRELRHYADGHQQWVRSHEEVHIRL